MFKKIKKGMEEMDLIPQSHATENHASDHTGTIHLGTLEGQNKTLPVSKSATTIKPVEIPAPIAPEPVNSAPMGKTHLQEQFEQLLLRAKTGNDLRDYYDLGTLYRMGWGVLPNPAEAEVWYNKAFANDGFATLKRLAESGDARAQYIVGLIYALGQCHIRRNDEVAVKWLRLAAEQGYAAAQNNLGVRYANGQGVNRSEARAVYWFRKAAAQGQINAQSNLKTITITPQLEQQIKLIEAEAERERLAKEEELKRQAVAERKRQQEIEETGLSPVQIQTLQSHLSDAIQKHSTVFLQQQSKTQTPIPITASKPLPATPKKNNVRQVRALYDYQSQSPEELSFNQNEVLQVLEEQGQWLHCRLGNKEGLVPGNYVEAFLPNLSLSLPLSTEPLSSKAEEESLIATGEIKISLNINPGELTREKILGAGGFGTVYLGRWHGNKVAIKELHLKVLTPEALEEFQHEAQMMVQLHSPFVVPLYGITTQSPYYMVMEHMKGGSLTKLLESKENLNWKRRTKLALEIARGLLFLHHKDIVHRDLKSMNVLLDAAGHAKLADFGLARVKNQTSTHTTQQNVGTLLWKAPEISRKGGKYTKASDIYSLGMVLWEIASRKLPFAEDEEPLMIPVRILQGEREVIPTDTPDWYRELIEACWDGKAEVRPSIEDVVKRLEQGYQAEKDKADKSQMNSTDESSLSTSDSSNSNNNSSNINTSTGSGSGSSHAPTLIPPSGLLDANYSYRETGQHHYPAGVITQGAYLGEPPSKITTTVPHQTNPGTAGLFAPSAGQAQAKTATSIQKLYTGLGQGK